MPYDCTKCGKHLETGELCECREKTQLRIIHEELANDLNNLPDIRHQAHYEQFVIQPKDFIIKNELSFCQGNAIKYICRYQMKGGVEDLEKAKHYIDMMIEEMGEKK
jgi:hypothetical protein